MGHGPSGFATRLRLQIHTHRTSYNVLVLVGSVAFLSNHPPYCPSPVLVAIRGSTRAFPCSRSFIGRGMRLEFHDPDYRTPIITSPFQEI